MQLKQLTNELKRRKGTFILIALTVALSAFALASGLHLIFSLVDGLDDLSEKTQVADVIQMNDSDVDEGQLEDFVKDNNSVEKYQLVDMISVDGSSLYLNGNNQADSVMDISFVKQNTSFDYLLDSKDKLASLKVGEIGVPLYFYEKENLQVGDTVSLKTNQGDMTFIVATFIRDGAMNASSVSSKRFLISDEDYKSLKEKITDKEYLIEFQLYDQDQVSEFENTYINASMPSQGPMVDGATFKLLNGLSEGLVILLMIFISLLLMILALQAIRFTFDISMEEDMKEIGTLKAIGIPFKIIRQVYLLKYVTIAFVGCFLGWITSLMTSEIFLEPVKLYMGDFTPSKMSYILPSVLVFMIVLIVYLYVLHRLGRIQGMHVIEALHLEKTRKKIRTGISLKSWNPGRYLQVFMGMRSVLLNKRGYLLPFVLSIIATFIILIPMNLLTTISDSSFINYMGVPAADIRLDLQNLSDVNTSLNKVIQVLESDPQVANYGAYATCRYEIMDDKGEWSTMNVEIGDFDAFPLTYISGKAPSNSKEIALSALAASELGVSKDDELEVSIEGQVEKCQVTGIYQDITNGGKSAKGQLPINEDRLSWYVVNVDLVDGVDKEEKMTAWNQEFEEIKITDTKDYINQTLASVQTELRHLCQLAILIAILVTILLLALFIYLVMIREAKENVIKAFMGLSKEATRLEYLSRIFFIALLGLICGVILANNLGASLVGLIGSSFGMVQMRFIIVPWTVYALVPLILLLTFVVTTWLTFEKIWKNQEMLLVLKG